MKTKLVYIDTSAYLTLLLNQEKAALVEETVRGASVHTSTVLFLEAHRNLIHLTRTGELDEFSCAHLLRLLTDDCLVFIAKESTMDICFNIQFPSISLPKSLDLLHLRTALWFKKTVENIKFLSLDKQQMEAARQLQLDVIEL